jgi:glycosyltransferase involved in cell wall biosynthesis
MEKQNKFKLIVPSYNNEQWAEYNLASILNQTYQNFEVVYINDASDDTTLEKVNSIVGNNKKFNIINNKTNKGAAYNYVEFVDKFVDDEDIIVHLDGDDWLIDEHVLYKLNQTYIENDYWMTYGQFLVFDGNEYRKSNPQGTAHSDYVHQFKLYRRDDWRASHLRTYKGKLFKATIGTQVIWLGLFLH